MDNLGTCPQKVSPALIQASVTLPQRKEPQLERRQCDVATKGEKNPTAASSRSPYRINLPRELPLILFIWERTRKMISIFDTEIQTPQHLSKNKLQVGPGPYSLKEYRVRKMMRRTRIGEKLKEQREGDGDSQKGNQNEEVLRKIQKNIWTAHNCICHKILILLRPVTQFHSFPKGLDRTSTYLGGGKERENVAAVLTGQFYQSRHGLL